MRGGRLAALAGGAALALTGCEVGPRFVPPRPQLPGSFAASPDDVSSRTFAGEIDPEWWRGFKDPELTSLVDRLARQNLDLKSAAERVRQARQEEVIAGAAAAPQIDGKAEAVHERESANGPVSLVEPAPGAPLEFNDYHPQVTASWEIDLFGRVRRSVEAAAANAEAAADARRGLALSAVADLAQDYFELRAIQARERIVTLDLEASARRIRLVQIRRENGVATNLEVAQAEAQGASLAQDLPTLRRQGARTMNAIAFLLAEAPRSLEAELAGPGSPIALPPAVPVGVPSGLIRRRPDILQAEAQLHAATAQEGVAVADFFPSVSLNGNAGFESLHLENLFDASSRSFMIGPTLSVPLFEGGRLKGRLELRRAQEREAALAYQKVVLQSLHDVDNALTAYARAQETARSAGLALTADEAALAAARDQYAHGVVTFLNVIEAQASVYQAEEGQVRATGEVETALVSLFKALGGGWEPLTPRGRTAR